MNLKTMAIGVAVLAIIAAALFFAAQQSTETPDPHVDQPLVSSETLAKATRIVISGKTAEEPTVLDLKQSGDENLWVLPNFYGAPADFEDIASLSKNLTDTKIQRFVSNRPETLERLNLEEAQVELKAGDKSLWKMAFGDSGPAAGMFVQFAGDKGAYLTTRTFSVDVPTAGWIDGRPFDEDFDIADVEKVVVTFPEGEAKTVHRKAGKFVYADAPKGKRIAAGAFFRFVVGVIETRVDRFVPESDESAVDVSKLRKVDVDLIFKEGRKLEMSMYPVEVEKPAPDPVDPAEADKPAAPTLEAEKLVVKIRAGDYADDWKETFERCVLEFPKFMAERVPQAFDDWLEDAPIDTAPVDTAPKPSEPEPAE